MKRSSKLLTQLKLGGCLVLFAGLCALASPAAFAQNIDEGKSATRLFADSCATCHRSARGLARGRYRPALFMFLHDHYTTGSGQAWELASYLASVDIPQRSRPRTTAAHSKTGTHHQPTVRPPAPIP